MTERSLAKITRRETKKKKEEKQMGQVFFLSKGGKCGRLESGVGWVSGENDKERNKWGTLESGVGGVLNG